MNDLELDFEFIYGIDFYNLKYDRLGNDIIYPNLIFDFSNLNNYKMYGCTLAHYQAVLQAYELGYNNVLIIEDDMCFTKDNSLLEKYLNNLPEDSDFITYTARFLSFDEINMFNNELINNSNNYIKLDNYYSLCGTGMYGLINRNAMKLYLDNQREKFCCADHVQGFFENHTVNRYTTLDAIILDQFNVLKRNNYNNNDNERGIYCYKQRNIINDYNSFYQPPQFNLSNININLELSLEDDKL